MNKLVREEFFKKLTRFERARIISARAFQLELNAPFMIEFDEETLRSVNYDPVRLARIEFEKGVVPLRIKRFDEWTKGKLRDQKKS
ncbi:MAG: DNA-directed RNA polymerase subunit K [Candidatus Woesearchaeota archaeon]